MKFKLIKIEKIEKKNYTGKVYDLTVKDTHSYNINNIIVHNSDLVMCGSILAGTDESPGQVLKVDGKLKKLFRGAASFSVQQESNSEKDIIYNEGNELLVDYKGSVEKVIKRFKAGLQSSMAYMNSKNIAEFQNNVEICIL